MDLLQSLNSHSDKGLFSESQKSDKSQILNFFLKHLRHLVQVFSETNYVKLTTKWSKHPALDGEVFIQNSPQWNWKANNYLRFFLQYLTL